jgi:phosphoglycerate dehydrogenase-like enzyme
MGKQLRGADVIIDYGGHNGTREMADAGASIKLWQIISVGYENFDVEYWRDKSIPLANCPGQTSANALAECAFMFMLMLARRWKETQANMAEGIFSLPMGTELEGKSLAVLGFGASGRALARRASAFRMRVSAIEARPVSEEEKSQFGLEFAGTPDHIDRVVSQSDYISLHLPLTQETRRIIDARRLRLMKPTARLINVARGALVDEDALYQALVVGAIAGAGLDVFDPEPIDPNHPLLKLPNVVTTPHLAGNTFPRHNAGRSLLPRMWTALRPVKLLAVASIPNLRILKWITLNTSGKSCARENSAWALASASLIRR